MSLYYFISNHCNLTFFSFKNHQQWWQQAKAQRAENEKDSVIESEKSNEQISGISVEDPVVDEERHTAHPAKRRKVGLGKLSGAFSFVSNTNIYQRKLLHCDWLKVG